MYRRAGIRWVVCGLVALYNYASTWNFRMSTRYSLERGELVSVGGPCR